MREATKRYIRRLKASNSVSKTYPSEKQGKNYERETTCNAVNVTKKSYKICTLCKADKCKHEHFMNQCKKYPAPALKIEKLKLLKGCTKCAYLSHETNKCHFSFNSRCRNCNGFHMTYLCTKRDATNETTSNLNWTKAYSTNSADAIILPTMTFKLGNSDNIVRVLEDGGSQRSFVSESFSFNNKLPIVRKINLTINGFNSSKNLLRL